jgi:proline-rich protein PRCC
MALVNYDSSDDELQDSSDGEDLPQVQTSKETKARVELNEESIRETNLFSRLPAPKTLSSTQSSLVSNSLNDIIVDKSRRGPVRITVPSLKHFSEDNEESDEEIKKSKRFKKSSSGTGLSALLPKPKSLTSITTKSLTPQSVSRPKPHLPPPKSLTKPLVINEDNSHQKVDYFSIDDSTGYAKGVINNDLISNDPVFGPKPQSTEPTNVCIAPKIDEYEDHNNYEISNPSISSAKSIPSVDDITYKKLIASKFGEESAQEINIIDIDVSQHLSQSKDWLKTISEEKEEPYNGVQPSSTARRKHQITYLAFQAKQREVELKNQWAQNKMTKSQTRSKYGF